MLHNGIVTELPALPDHAESEALSINEYGVIIGLVRNMNTGLTRAVAWHDGKITALNLPMGPRSEALDISDTGLVCGWMGVFISPQATSHAFIYNLNTNGTIDIGTPLPGTVNAQAVAINSQGNVCGRSAVDCGELCVQIPGFFWSSGHAINLGHLPRYPRCRPRDINDSNIIVGESATDIGNSRAFVWRNGVMQALDDLVPAELNLRIYNAMSINNAGQIAAYGHIITATSAIPVALRLNPVPPLHGDITCDWLVNQADLLQVIANWGPAPPQSPAANADINADGMVNVSDLLAVIHHWS